MNIISGIIIVLIFAADIYLFASLKKNKIKVCGKNPYAAIIQTLVAFFVLYVIIGHKFNLINTLLLFGAAFYLLFGNGNGVCEKGVVSFSRLIPWDKVEKFSIENEDKGKAFIYYVNNIEKKIIFKNEDEKQLISELAACPISNRTSQKFVKQNKKNKKK